jgi:hypothetical protein
MKNSTRMQTAAAGIAALVLGTVGIMVGVLPTLASASASQSTTTNSVSIPGNQTWTDTGVALTAGESVSISMSGGITYLRGEHTGAAGESFANGIGCGANQYSNPPSSSEPFPAYGVPCWGSIFKIGTTGIPFPTGKAVTFVAPVSGELFIGVNDNFVSDNHGAFTASISAS